MKTNQEELYRELTYKIVKLGITTLPSYLIYFLIKLYFFERNGTEGVCFVSNEYLAKEYNISIKGIQCRLRKLKKQDLIYTSKNIEGHRIILFNKENSLIQFIIKNWVDKVDTPNTNATQQKISAQEEEVVAEVQTEIAQEENMELTDRQKFMFSYVSGFYLDYMYDYLNGRLTAETKARVIYNTHHWDKSKNIPLNADTYINGSSIQEIQSYSRELFTRDLKFLASLLTSAEREKRQWLNNILS